MTPKVVSIISDVLNLPPGSIGPDASSDMLEKWDSLQHLNIILALEEEFGVQLEPDEIVRMNSVPQIVDVLRSRGLADAEACS